MVEGTCQDCQNFYVNAEGRQCKSTTSSLLSIVHSWTRTTNSDPYVDKGCPAYKKRTPVKEQRG